MRLTFYNFQFIYLIKNKKFQGASVYVCYCYKLLLSRDPIFLLRFHHHFVPLFLIILISIHRNFFLYLYHAEKTIWDHKSTKCYLHEISALTVHSQYHTPTHLLYCPKHFSPRRHPGTGLLQYCNVSLNLQQQLSHLCVHADLVQLLKQAQNYITDICLVQLLKFNQISI